MCEIARRRKHRCAEASAELSLAEQSQHVTHVGSNGPIALFLTVFTVALLNGSAAGDDWPQWLGPKRAPVWDEERIVDRFPNGGPPLLWESKVAGGYSGPAVANRRVFVMDFVSSHSISSGKLLHEGAPPNNPNFVRRSVAGKERVLCLSADDGRLLWKHQYDCQYTSVALYAIGPRCTPTVDDDRVYTLGAEGELQCLRVQNGSLIWSRSFVDDFGLDVPEWGVAAHPLIEGDKVICMVGGPESTVVAFNKFTGEVVWRALSARQPGYCPPMIYPLGGRRQLVIWDSDQIAGLNPDTGEVHWKVPFEATFAMTIGAPQPWGNHLFVMAFNRKSALIKVADDGASAELAWVGDTRRGIGGVLNTAVIVDGYVYACDHGGRYLCIDALTGEQAWSTFAPSTGTRPAAWANVFTIRNKDRFFHANDFGDLIIARMTPNGYQEIDRAHLIDPTHEVSGRRLVWSHPAFANRRIYLRNDEVLRCYSLEKP